MNNEIKNENSAGSSKFRVTRFSLFNLIVYYNVLWKLNSVTCDVSFRFQDYYFNNRSNLLTARIIIVR